MRFTEKDPAPQSHWFDLQLGKMLEELLLEAGKERQIYVITSDPPERLEWVHDPWPRLGNAQVSISIYALNTLQI